jgi:hypothetical protein
MDKVLKIIQSQEYHFPQILLHYSMYLQFKFDVYGKKILSDT